MATGAESIAFWNEHQVAEFPEDVTEAESLRAIEVRNALYPHLLEFMPVDYPGYDILDFGCGPGHDTIQFLLNGAKHVYAVDSSRKGLAALRARLKAHGFEDRCTTILAEQDDWYLPPVDRAHAAGVIHHLADPARALRAIARAVRPHAEIRMMVYSAESEVYLKDCKGDPELFRRHVDSKAPISNAWTKDEVVSLAAEADLYATYLGNYRVPSETTGPGLSSCWSLHR